MARCLPGQQCRGIAHVEPLGKVARGGDARQRRVQARKLVRRHAAVGFIGGKQVRHHRFQLQRRAGREARQQRRQPVGSGALAAHPGINFKMNGQASRVQPRGLRGRFQFLADATAPRQPASGDWR